MRRYVEIVFLGIGVWIYSSKLHSQHNSHTKKRQIQFDTSIDTLQSFSETPGAFFNHIYSSRVFAWYSMIWRVVVKFVYLSTDCEITATRFFFVDWLRRHALWLRSKNWTAGGIHEEFYIGWIFGFTFFEELQRIKDRKVQNWNVSRNSVNSSRNSPLKTNSSTDNQEIYVNMCEVCPKSKSRNVILLHFGSSRKAIISEPHVLIRGLCHVLLFDPPQARHSQKVLSSSDRLPSERGITWDLTDKAYKPTYMVFDAFPTPPLFYGCGSIVIVRWRDVRNKRIGTAPSSPLYVQHGLP